MNSFIGPRWAIKLKKNKTGWVWLLGTVGDVKSCEILYSFIHGHSFSTFYGLETLIPTGSSQSLRIALQDPCGAGLLQARAVGAGESSAARRHCLVDQHNENMSKGKTWKNQCIPIPSFNNPQVLFVKLKLVLLCLGQCLLGPNAWLLENVYSRVYLPTQRSKKMESSVLPLRSPSQPHSERNSIASKMKLA